MAYPGKQQQTIRTDDMSSNTHSTKKMSTYMYHLCVYAQLAIHVELIATNILLRNNADRSHELKYTFEQNKYAHVSKQ
jgi:hypothetical protein